MVKDYKTVEADNNFVMTSAALVDHPGSKLAGKPKRMWAPVKHDLPTRQSNNNRTHYNNKAEQNYDMT